MARALMIGAGVVCLMIAVTVFYGGLLYALAGLFIQAGIK
jgi:hypothetical protein